MSVAEPLDQGVNARDQLIDVHVDNFLRKKYIAATADSIIHPTRKLFFALIRLSLDIPEALYHFRIVLRLGVVDQQILHHFESEGDFCFCQWLQADHCVIMAMCKPFQE